MATLITSSPHVALFPCAGMGHLLPFLHLAAMLTSRGCTVTVITAHPTVSTAKLDHLSTFFATHPHIRRLPFQLLPYKKSNFTNDDPFFIQVETIANSLHLLYPLISSLSPSLSAIFADFPVTNTITNLASDLSIPTYTVITTSATFFSVTSHLPQLARNKNHIEVPGLGPTPVSNIPPPLRNPNHFFTANICSNVPSLNKVKGILINTSIRSNQKRSRRSLVTK
ncbi:hypothetical protein BUALT_Bualt04G0140100 [Buddleja alternifolia]|uniref:Uncharacterized protein n=1 Tax=Buddleja alternifolia TaxID=168488 RepID=A0AAV6XNS0_9LAMI|nr:hypothetical protein BUALT_Bualt04G0140100 [Buddleja alternifolia]